MISQRKIDKIAQSGAISKFHDAMGGAMFAKSYVDYISLAVGMGVALGLKNKDIDKLAEKLSAREDVMFKRLNWGKAVKGVYTFDTKRKGK